MKKKRVYVWRPDGLALITIWLTENKCLLIRFNRKKMRIQLPFIEYKDISK